MSLIIEKKDDNYVKLIWPVKLCQSFAKNYYSDQFRIDNINNVSFSMKLELGGSSLKPTFNLSVRKSNSEPAYAVVKVMIGNFLINQSHEWISSCYFSDIIIPKGVEIIPQFTVYSFGITCEIFWKSTPTISLDNNLYNEMRKFYNSEELSDVTIIVDETKIPAHKVVLAAQSEVFAKMLQSEMKEAKDGEINIKDHDPEIILEMLHYCYRGATKARYNIEIALQMLEVANYYQIMKLKEISKSTLMNNMSVDNVIRIIDTADNYDAVDLRQKAKEFIIAHCKELFPSNEFQELFFRKQKLMLEIVRALGDK
ncbi:kelch-like protein 38 [Cotesia glomerata]|uniref:kelch-like protein 38 n=1 Tax=Cotesia glomerata TaxID=32391 RepID=UPI001D00C80B|nr:kelch-like protein 38 [Cotesia glomerata]